MCNILQVFWIAATHIIFGNNYPTTNLYLNEVFWIKVVPDSKDDDEDYFIRSVVQRM